MKRKNDQHDNPIDVITTLSIDRIRSLLITGIESGSYGSFIVVGYDTGDWKVEPHIVSVEPDKSWPGYAYWPTLEGCAAILQDKYELQDGNEDTPELRLDLDAIKRGLQLLSDKYPYHFSDIITNDDDVLTGDALIQCALLGDIVYA